VWVGVGVGNGWVVCARAGAGGRKKTHYCQGLFVLVLLVLLLLLLLLWRRRAWAGPRVSLCRRLCACVVAVSGGLTCSGGQRSGRG